MTAQGLAAANLSVLRDSDGIAHIVGLSGGKDSTCLALALREKEPRPYNYVFTPTGDELPEMAAHLINIQEMLGQKIIKIPNKSLAQVCKENNAIPSFRTRFCTRIIKLKPAADFYKCHAPVIAYIGLRADEEGREGMRPGGAASSIGDASVLQDYPFQRWGWDVMDVWGFLGAKGVAIPDRTDCARCPYQKLGEWYNLWAYHPDIWADCEADEEKYGHTFRSPGRDTWPAALKDLRALFEKGIKPDRSLQMMDQRQGMCRACSL